MYDEKNKITNKKKIIIGVMSMIVSFIPFAHNFVPRFEGEFIGFKSFVAFVYAIGMPITITLFGIIVLYVFNMYTNLKKLMIIPLPFIFTGVFHIVWALWDGQKFQFAYYAAIALISVTFTIAFRLIVVSRYQYVNTLVLDFFEFIVKIRDKYFAKLLSKAIEKDIYDITYQKKLKEISDEFDEKIAKEYEKYTV